MLVLYSCIQNIKHKWIHMKVYDEVVADTSEHFVTESDTSDF